MLKKIIEFNKLLTIADKIAIISIFSCSGLLILLTPRLVAGTEGAKDVVITLNENEIYRYKLNANQDLKRVEFDFEFEGETYEGILKMKDGKVRLERLNQDISPLPIHAEMGWISEPHQMIVCLPIKLTVTIEADSSQPQNVDVKTF